MLRLKRAKIQRGFGGCGGDRGLAEYPEVVKTGYGEKAVSGLGFRV